jgi:hypothetical protein
MNVALSLLHGREAEQTFFWFFFFSKKELLFYGCLWCDGLRCALPILQLY